MNNNQLKMVANSLKVADLFNTGVNISDIENEIYEINNLISNIKIFTIDYLNQFIQKKIHKYYYELYKSNLLCYYNTNNPLEIYITLIKLQHFLILKRNKILFLVPVKHLAFEYFKSKFLK
ncbi:hypothetical protein [Cetobacterium sp.]|uniref:hypothetical protein n=2 Tax=Cetobacterium sp. TaxID=2071632 RepID=UPI002FC66C15